MNKRGIVIFLCVAAFCLDRPAVADFKYSESTKITGGMLAGLMKFAGAFSKNVNEPTVSTVYVKGNRFRRDSSDGSAEIIDLDGRRIININREKRTYSVMTFEQMRQAAQAAQQRMQEKMREKGQDPQLQNAQLNISPKVEMTPTGNTRQILGQVTREVKLKVDMQMQLQDKSNTSAPQNANGSMTMTSDIWVASSVTGYREVKEFYKRMAKEINWMSLPTAGLRIDPRAARGMQEVQKSSSQMEGLPMVQYVSMYMGMQPQAGGTAATAGASGSGAQGSQTASAQASDGSIPLTANQAAVKALSGALGGFGGFGRRKKKQDQQAEQNSPDSSNAGSSAASGAPVSSPGSFMDLTSQITSFSSDSLDAGLFEIPAGYVLVQGDSQKMIESNQR